METASETGTLHLLIGPVGAGKSTWAARWSAHRPALVLDLDTCMVRLFGEDTRPESGVMQWYMARRARVSALLWQTAVQALHAGADVVLELGLVTAAEREAACRTALAEGFQPVVHLIDAPRDVRRERVERRNREAGPHTQVVPPAFFERASDAWEPVSAAEREAWAILDG